jgi:biotin transport system substrate-specific component
MSFSYQSGTLSERLSQAVPARSARYALGITGFVVLTALSARLALPVPGTAVPFTFQVFAVLLAGVLLGPRLGAASQIAYLTVGIAGLPVFAFGAGAAYLFGPTGGYLLATPLAAFVAGLLAGPSVWRMSTAAVAGLAVIYAGGLSWLAVFGSLNAAIAVGIQPFLVADLVKVVLVVIVALRFRGEVLRFMRG